MRVAIVGGHGKIALLLTEQLTGRRDHVVSIIRNPAHERDVREAGGLAVIADLERIRAGELADRFDDADAVVFAAGAGPGSTAERKHTVDYGASVLAARAAALAGIDRFVQISAFRVDDELPEDVEPVWRAYVEAKRDADAALRATGLDWTILRPGALTDDPGIGRIELAGELARDDEQGTSIPRADVAATIVALLDNPGSVHRTWEVVSGPDPIVEAVARAADAG